METKSISAVDKFYETLEKVKKEKKTTFSLSNTTLNTIPEELWSLTHLKYLSLSSNQIIAIPEDIAKLKHLEVLSIDNNQLSALPKVLNSLPLKKLNIGNNNFTELPNCIFDCKNLEILNFGNLGMGMNSNTNINKIENIPGRIGALKNLRVLRTSGNLLTTLPDALFDLKHIEELILEGIADMWWDKLVSRGLPRKERFARRREVMAKKAKAGLAEISANIGQLKSLKRLAMNYNRLCHIPKEIGNLSQLQFLNIADNRLKTLPENLVNLSKLNELRIDGNQIQDLPAWIGKLPQLRELRVFGNPVYNSGKNDEHLKTVLSNINYVDLFAGRR